MEVLSVTYPYLTQRVLIAPTAAEAAAEIVRQGYDVRLAVIDQNVATAQPDLIESLLQEAGCHETITLRPEAASKDFDCARAIIARLAGLGATRRSCLVAIGGGYVGDIVGFVASVYMRGIDFLQVPTTFMSMSDAVMGKVAINFEGRKNLLGNFFSPRLTLCLPDLLESLPPNELYMGLVEVWKHALLVRSEETLQEVVRLLEEVGSPADEQALGSLVSFSLATKARFVEGDHDDRLDRHKALSLGHTLANYLERWGWMRHGMAVMYGIAFEARLSRHMGKIGEAKQEDILRCSSLFERHFQGWKRLSDEFSLEEALESFRSDKISYRGEYSFVIPTDKGYSVERGLPERTVRKALEEFLRSGM